MTGRLGSQKNNDGAAVGAPSRYWYAAADMDHFLSEILQDLVGFGCREGVDEDSAGWDYFWSRIRGGPA